MTKFSVGDQIRIKSTEEVGLVFSTKQAPSSYRVGLPSGETTWTQEREMELVSRPSQGQRLVPVTLDELEVGDPWFMEYVVTDRHGGGFSQIATGDNGYCKRYRLVDGVPQEPPSVAQCVKALRAVIQVELDESGRAAERLGALRDDILEYEEEG